MNIKDFWRTPPVPKPARSNIMRDAEIEAAGATMADFWGSSQLSGVSRNQAIQASTNRAWRDGAFDSLGVGRVEATTRRPTRAQELPFNIHSRVWYHASSDTTRTDLRVDCAGGCINLTIEYAPIAGARTPREVIEDLQQQLVRQLALIALKED